MQNIVTIGRRMIPAEEIVLVETFDPSSNPAFKTVKEFKARVVLLDRDSVLIEQTPEMFSEQNGFHLLADDAVGMNPAIAFRVEAFTPTESFRPTKPYLTRVKWRDRFGKEQSKLLLSKPETVVAVALRGEAASSVTDAAPASPPARRRTVRRRAPRPDTA